MGGGVPSIQSCRINMLVLVYLSEVLFHLVQNDSKLIYYKGHNPMVMTSLFISILVLIQRQIVKNHRQNGQWGQEENQPFPQYMPLMPGTQIDLQIACNP